MSSGKVKTKSVGVTVYEDEWQPRPKPRPGEQRCREGASCDYDRITDVWAFARLPANRRPKVLLCTEHQARIEALAKRSG